MLSNMSGAVALHSVGLVSMASRRRHVSKPKQSQSQSQSHVGGFGFGLGGQKKEELWRCVEGCGACCKLNKGPSFATPEEIFHDPSDIQLYRSMIGPDGWCVHYDKTTRKCSIYSDRPYFCRVEPDVFEALYGISNKKFNKEACSSCRDTIKAIYGSDSKELLKFNHSVRS
ncbi:hypothetical protein TIFTF001_008274 [Ficus carica]|uniref:Uncharacterized protein n=1 Tax=Ficus carica TaxID=3494 RepID=A0AA88D2P9_FICCA|nr:hypothetical protein TIFTF001_008274 [Ficus carica]